MKLDLQAPPLSRRSRLWITAGIAIGGIVFAVGLFAAPDRIWMQLFLVVTYLLGLALAGTFFVALQHVTGSSWSVVLRRIPEAMSSLVPAAAAATFLILLVRPQLYPWTAAGMWDGQPAMAFKSLWLSRPFFLARAAVYLGLWVVFALALNRASFRQDVDSGPDPARRSLRLPAAFMVVFALTFWLASFDWIMSLEPHWTSTIFGVYNFAGMFLGGLAAITLLVIWLRAAGPLRRVVTEEHLHDLGKLLFAFSTFWMYIWFSQYMLIWYADIPEEAVYFVKRLRGRWEPLFMLNIALNWAVPFLALLLGAAKRNPVVLGRVSAAILIGRWVDLYLMLGPAANRLPRITPWEIGLLPAGAALFILLFRMALARHALVPVGDPRLARSLRHHQ